MLEGNGGAQMQFRRSMMSSVMLLLLAGVVASTVAHAEVIQPAPLAIQKALKAKALTKLRTNDVGDPDTVFIGHVMGATGLPGVAGGYGPFHIGRGGNLETDPLNKGGAANNGYWNFDDLNAGEADTHQGWWILGEPQQSTSSAVRNDWWRASFNLDYGNAGNLKGNGMKPTYGVTGYWHRDGGNLQAPVAHVNPNNGPAPSVGPTWTPLGGNASAWCGLRAHGDFAYTDPVTGGVYNSSIVNYHGDNHNLQTGPFYDVVGAAGGTDMNFPGYGDQWDQILYRDVAIADGLGLALSYKYDVNLVAGHSAANLTRTGWFNMDPVLDIVAATSADPLVKDGNFISSSAFDGAAPDLAPEDSFMVYVGVPVDDAAVTYTDGSIKPVGDPDRRWFSEVLQIDGWTPGGPGVGDVWPATLIQLASISGTAAGAPAVALTNGQIQPMLNKYKADHGVGTGKVRIVFRVKTNRGWSDEDTGFNAGSSGTKGAAIVDDVVANGWAVANGDFEAAGSINNAAAADAAWHSTGKPVGEDYWELKDIATLSYNDPCGLVGAPNRNCNMFGNVMSAVQGNLLDNDGSRLTRLLSPTINLVSTGDGFYNDMGIDAEIADVTGDILMFYDIYTNLINFGTTGNGLRAGWQTYPSVQLNGVKTWGVWRKTIFFGGYTGFLGCYGGVDFPGLMPPGSDGGYLNGLIVTTNASGIPDSLRINIEELSICHRRAAVTPVTCNAAGLAELKGFYADNISIAFADAPPPPGISNSIWDVWQDAFPTNSNLAVNTDPFRRGTVQVKSGYNKSQGTGDLFRNVIPGDTMLVISNGSPIRTDLVFRIKPGPGNYQTIGNPASGIRPNPATAGSVTPGDGSFWGSYMADRGLYGSGFAVGFSTAVPNPMTDGVAGGGAVDWNPDEWVSARMDTAQNNLFDANSVGGNVSQLKAAQFMSTYHESELGIGAPRATLGVVKSRCVLIDIASGASVSADNVDCGSGTTPPHPSGKTWADRWNAAEPINYVTSMGGYTDGTCNGPCAVGTTAEFTKIIPDNQLTPGSHVEWFFRRTFEGNFTAFEMLPDTTQIYPNVGAGIFDGARWYTMNALPDEWKNPSYNNFGYPASTGLACMLYVDQGDRRGDHVLWDNLAGVIGLTSSWKRGAGSAYYIPATADFPGDLAELATVGGTLVSKHFGQEGSVYDVYNVRAGESNVPAGRLGSRDGAPCIGLATGKCSTAGPTKTWLRELYQHLFVSCADLGQQTWGPLPDQTDGDMPMLKDFVDNSLGTPAPRNLIIGGLDIVQGSSTAAGGDITFFPTYFDAGYVADSYRDFALSTDDAPDLIPDATFSPGGAIYGVFSSCFTLNDVLDGLGTITGSTEAWLYEDTNPLDLVNYPAAIYAPADIPGNRFANTLVFGFTHGTFGGMGSRYTLGRSGYNTFWLDALTGMIGTICGTTLTAPVGVGDGGINGKAFVNFMNLRSPNPMKSGTAVIEFGLAKNEKVQVNVYDVTGRLVKTLADREFKAGDIHRLTWNGTNEGGQSVARGVYFYQLRSPSFTSQKKLTVLRD
jgi:hypothetical protein